MKICLVTAPITTEFVELEELNSVAVRRAAAEPQLGVLSLAAVLEAQGIGPEMVDLDNAYLSYVTSARRGRSGDFAQAAANQLAANNAGLYGFSSICSSYPLTIRIARELKALRPSATILFGGPQASVVDLSTLADFPFVDLVLRGEAERSLLLLLAELRGESVLANVPGLTYRENGVPRRNAPSLVITDLDSLPMPAYHLTGILQNAASASLELGRGCPFACTFCSTNDFFRRNFRLRSPQRVLRDMQAIATNYGIRSFVLVHDMFTVDRRKVLAFCDAMIASDEGFTWSCSARTDCVDEELLALMFRAGCRGVFFGVEAGSERMQKIIDKHLDPQRAEEIVDVAERLGMRTTVSLIAGFPEETWTDVRDTLRIFMHSARCAQSSPQLNILAPLAETPLFTKYKDQLILDDLCSDMSHQGGSQQQADLDLIQKHRDIFPNFYLFPTPHLERDALLELREFLLVGVGRFRWLLSALEQATTGILDVFLAWRRRRLHLHAGLRGTELRHYYRTDLFRKSFVQFVSEQPAGQTAAVKALLECEYKLRRRDVATLPPRTAGIFIRDGANLRLRDVPVRTKHAAVVELGCDIQMVVEGLKQCREPEWVYSPHFYVTQETPEGLNRLVRISSWMAALLRACDGRRTIESVARYLSDALTEVKQSMRGYVASQLIKGAREQGYIRAYRPVVTSRRPSNAQVCLRRDQIAPENRMVRRGRTAR